MLVIPIIELSEGESVSIISAPQADMAINESISKDPMALSMLWRKENAKCIHLIDRDSFDGRNNLLNANSVLYLLNAVDIPLQYSSDFSSTDECRMFLESGIYRVVISDLAIIEPEKVSKLIKDYTPSRVAFQANCDGNVINFNNLKKQIRLPDYASLIKNLGGDRLIFAPNDGINFEDDSSLSNISKIAEEQNLKVSILDNVSKIEEFNKIKEINNINFDSCIIGKPFYENTFPCQTLWRMAEMESGLL